MWRKLECRSIAIDDQECVVTWRIVGRLIAREISTVNLHLIDGYTRQNRVHRITFNLCHRSQGVITVEIKSWKTHLMRAIAIQRRAFSIRHGFILRVPSRSNIYDLTVTIHYHAFHQSC